MSATLPMQLSPATRRQASWILAIGAVIGLVIGLDTLVLHLRADPFADTYVYYNAGSRLNAGGVLYDQSEKLYLYPPLLAILFRPLALLPFEAAALIWEAVVVGAMALAVWRTWRRLGTRRLALVLGCLAMPILWTLSIGQAEALVTLLLVLGTPLSVAVAGHLKLMPLLVAIHWLAIRRWDLVLRLAIWVGVLGLIQLVLEPRATLAYLRLEWLRPAFEVRNISPYAVHPVLWVVLVVGLVAGAIRFANTRWGWPLAVALAVFAYPRLLAYQLSTLLAAFAEPARPRVSGSSETSTR